MSNNFTRDYYLGMWGQILTTYQQWGHDLTSLLDEIQKSNPTAVQVFSILYTKVNENFIATPQKSPVNFYQKLNALIPKKESLYTKLNVTALKSANKHLAINEKCFVERSDYLLAILCFIEEVAMLSLKDKNVSSSGNLLTAHAQNICIYVESNNKLDTTVVKLIIPCELCIEYYVSTNKFS